MVQHVYVCTIYGEKHQDFYPSINLSKAKQFTSICIDEEGIIWFSTLSPDKIEYLKIDLSHWTELNDFYMEMQVMITKNDTLLKIVI
jgi:hypothetical protein